jgi:hypothetical protein
MFKNKKNVIYDNKRSNVTIELDKDKIIFLCEDDNDWNELFQTHNGERSVENNRITWKFNKDNKELKQDLITMIEDDPLFSKKLEEKEEKKTSLQDRLNNINVNVKKPTSTTSTTHERRVIYPRNEEEEERMDHKSLKIVDYTQFSLALFTPFYRDWGNMENPLYVNNQTKSPYTNKQILEEKLGSTFNWNLKQKSDTDKAPGWVIKKSDKDQLDFISSLMGLDENGKEQDIRSFFEVQSKPVWKNNTYNSFKEERSNPSTNFLPPAPPQEVKKEIPLTPMDYFYSLFKELQNSQPYPQRKTFDDEYMIIFGERDIIDKQIKKESDKYEIVADFSLKKCDNKIVLLRNIE